MYNKLSFYIKIDYTFKIQIFLVFYLNVLICYLSYSHFVFRSQRKSNLWKWFHFRTVLYIKYRCMHMNCTKGKIKKSSLLTHSAIFVGYSSECFFIILTACLVILLTYYYFNSSLSLTTCHKLVSLLEINKMVAIVGIHLNCELWNWVMG